MKGINFKNSSLWALLMVFLLLPPACHRLPDNLPDPDASTIKSALDEVLESKKLKVLTNYSSVNYYIYRGEPMGYQYEMLKAFTEHLGVRLELRIERNLEKAKQLLKDGKTHLIAMDLTVTGQRQQRMDFTEPIIISRQVLVQRLPDNWRQIRTRDEIEKGLLRRSLEFAGKKIHVQAGSVYRKRLETLADEIGDTIIISDDKRDVDELIAAVAKGDIDYTIADEHLARVIVRNYPNLDIKTPVSFDQKIAWALRKESNNELLKEINKWLDQFMTTTEARMLHEKYFNSGVRNRLASDYHSFSGGKLSGYDKTIQKVAMDIGWDWRLFASLIYQESEFKHEVSSWAGAFGIMQLMPPVMEQFGISTTSPVDDHIRVGGQYLQYLDRLIPETITDSLERIKFILAAYNSGVGHVLDARRLAAKYNKNPDIWTGHVDFFMRNKSRPAFYNDPVVYYGYVRGEETFLFVEQIIDRFEHYSNLISE